MIVKFNTLALATASSAGIIIGSVSTAISYLSAFNLHSGYPLGFTFASVAILLASIIGIDLAYEASRIERRSKQSQAAESPKS